MVSAIEVSIEPYKKDDVLDISANYFHGFVTTQNQVYFLVPLQKPIYATGFDVLDTDKAYLRPYNASYKEVSISSIAVRQIKPNGTLIIAVNTSNSIGITEGNTLTVALNSGKVKFT